MSNPISIQDTLAVQDLLARYCWYLDQNRGAEWAALYTEDGVFEGTRPQPVCGRPKLQEVPSQGWTYSKGTMRHQYTNLYIEAGSDENGLLVRFYNQVSTWTEGYKPLMLASCTATLVRANANAPWRIKRNTIEALR
jgi:hypothetical protein